MLILKLLVLPVLLSLGLFSTAQETQPAEQQETQPAEQKAFEIDTVHSTAIFKALHKGVGMFYGRFNDVTGSIGADGDMPNFNVSIAIDSVDTSNEKLDAHLKSPDFFNAVEFPSMSFKSNSAKKIGNSKYELIGSITMHGITKPLTVTMSKTGQATGRRGEMVGYETEFVLTRSDFGMTYGVESGSLSDKVTVIVALEASRK
jgi:polyisoprenoid-binding protein YceI